jgi:hypothetical protein
MAAFSLGFAVIAGAWFTQHSSGDSAIGVAFLLASVMVALVARAMAGPRVTVATLWGKAAYALLAELSIYAGLAGGVTLAGGLPGTAGSDGLSGLVGPQLRSGVIGHAGGTGAAGVWLLALVAAIILALHHLADLCAAGPPGDPGVLLPRLGSLRLLMVGLAVLLAGPRAALLAAVILGALGLVYVLIRPVDASGNISSIAGYRGDGPLSAWIGGFVNGRIPPMTPLTVGLLVTFLLAALGLGNLPGVLVLTPAEAMLLASLGSSHVHDGARDWRVPPLLHAGEYVYLMAAGYAGHVPAPVTFALIAAVGLRHLDMAYRARSRVPLSWFQAKRRARLPRADWRGLGWEGRMIVAGLAVLFGITPYAYGILAAYLGLLSLTDYLAGWSNAALEGSGSAMAGSGGHAAVHR